MKLSAASIAVTCAFSIGVGIVIGMGIPDFPQPAPKGRAPHGPSAADTKLSATDCAEVLETRAYEIAACSEDLQACYREKGRCERAVQSDEFLQMLQVCDEDLRRTKRLLDTCIQSISKD